MPRHSNIGMITTGHEHGIAVTHRNYKLGILGIVVHKLQSVRRRRHIEIDIHLLEHFSVLVRRPAGPVAWLGKSKSHKQPASLDILTDANIQMALLTGFAGSELQR